MSEFRVSFGLKYAWEEHPTFPAAHPDGWVTVVAEDYTSARAAVVARLGSKWSSLYDDIDYTSLGWEDDFPRGEIARWVAP